MTSRRCDQPVFNRNRKPSAARGGGCAAPKSGDWRRDRQDPRSKCALQLLQPSREQGFFQALFQQRHTFLQFPEADDAERQIRRRGLFERSPHSGMRLAALEFRHHVGVQQNPQSATSRPALG